MLTKGTILSRLSDDNHYLVRVPFFEQAGDTDISKIEAILSYTPGVTESLKEGDVVILGFEDHQRYSPIIIGKLYVNEKEARGYANVESLNVEKSVSLPNKLKIGDATFENFSEEFINLKDNVTENVDEISDLYSGLTPKTVGVVETETLYDIEGLNNSYNGVEVNIGSDYQGFYIFTYGNCMITLPIYGLVDSTVYKTSACLLDANGQYKVKVLSYKKVENMLYIYNKENFIPTGYTAYLFKVKLY